MWVGVFLLCVHGFGWWRVSEGVCDVSVTFMYMYMYWVHSHIYPEMACIRLGENAGVMDLAVKCTLQVRVWYFSSSCADELYYTVEPLYIGHHWDLAGCPVYSGTYL